MGHGDIYVGLRPYSWNVSTLKLLIMIQIISNVVDVTLNVDQKIMIIHHFGRAETIA